MAAGSCTDSGAMETRLVQGVEAAKLLYRTFEVQRDIPSYSESPILFEGMGNCVGLPDDRFGGKSGAGIGRWPASGATECGCGGWNAGWRDGAHDRPHVYDRA